MRKTRPRTRMQVSHPFFDSKVRLDRGCRGIRLDIMRDVPRHPVFLHKGTRPEDTDVEMKSRSPGIALPAGSSPVN